VGDTSIHANPQISAYDQDMLQGYEDRNNPVEALAFFHLFLQQVRLPHHHSQRVHESEQVDGAEDVARPWHREVHAQHRE